MKYTDIEIGMKVIVRPINFAKHEQEMMDDFPACNGREYKNRFWYTAEELNKTED